MAIAPQEGLNFGEESPSGFRTIDSFDILRKIGEGSYGKPFTRIRNTVHCSPNQVLHEAAASRSSPLSYQPSSNILVNNLGILKLGDFGLSREFLQDRYADYTSHAGPLMFRAPEILFGATRYREEVDMWSVGCVFGSLLLGRPIFQGLTEADQLSRIFALCGIPDVNNWPEVVDLPLYDNLRPRWPLQRRISEVFRESEPEAVNLLDRMLSLNPSQRISANDALEHNYFKTPPLPADPRRSFYLPLITPHHSPHQSPNTPSPHLSIFLPKMDLLEIPLEALAFRYSAALAGSLWAWLAVLTAALGLWRIRSSSGSKPVSLPSDPYPKPAPKPIVPAAQAEPLLQPAQPPTPSSFHVEDVGTPNKARFTTYYRDESRHSDDDGVESEEEFDGELSYSDSGIGWDKLMPVRRRGDLGWYCYQDIAVLNGSVVRLWDGPVTTGRRRGWSD
ncbi:hypothetical protein J5N97_009341 [Dioscorea zingiberensis]|uniref:Protein kinase domain-containing protein n=1 Tax=Dioscorea zingiberensis TaxID=325984 RepID=A0A9D5CX06_9LILI|nr:hypothetical protein J5N97_009341 [Dioscorea zingiberensis]